jgi:tetratricopeptide (TPR) repeat protein
MRHRSIQTMAAGALAALLLAADAGHAQRTVRIRGWALDLLEKRAAAVTNDLYPSSLPRFPLSDIGERPLLARGFIALENYQPPRTIQGAAGQHIARAREYIRQQEWDKAMFEINDGLAYEPNNPELIRMAAVVSTLQKDFYQADHYFERFLEFSPGNVEYLVGRAGVQLRLFDFEGARLSLRRAIDIDPRYLPGRFYELMIDLVELEDVDASPWEGLYLSDQELIANWIRADGDVYRNFLGPVGFEKLCNLVLGPGTANREDELVEAFQELFRAKAGGDRDAVQTAFDRLRDLGLTGPGLDMERLIFRYRSGEEREAIEGMQSLVERHPDLAFLRFNLGFMLLQQKQVEQAIAELERAVERDASMGIARFALAAAYAVIGRNQDAWTLLESLVRTHKEDLPLWLDGDAYYLDAIRRDIKYPALCRMLGIPPESE